MNSHEYVFSMLCPWSGLFFTIKPAYPKAKFNMKKHQILVMSEQSVTINDVFEKQVNTNTLAKHKISKTDLVTLYLTEEESSIEFSYEVYKLLKSFGYKNVDFTGNPHSDEIIKKSCA